MSISRRGLFGTLLGGIAAGYAAKVAPAYATGGVITVDHLRHGWASLNEVRAAEGLYPFLKAPESFMDLVRSAPITLLPGGNDITIHVTDGCTRDGDEGQAS